MTVSAYAAPLAKLQFTDSSGNFLNGGKLFCYVAGTTTKTTTYADAGEVTPNTNPIVLDSEGRCTCFIPPGQAVKFVLSPSTDTDPPTNAIWTVDNVWITTSGVPFALDTGTSGAMVATVIGLPTTLVQGNSFIIYPANACNGDTTVNVNATSAIHIRDQYGNTLQTEAYAASQPLLLTYDGTYWRAFIEYPGLGYAVDSGTSGALIATIPTLPSTLITGMNFLCKAAHAAAGSDTINVNGTGSNTIKKAGGASTSSNDFASGQVILFTYDGTNWRTLF